YEVPVYTSKLSISGSFPAIDSGRANPDDLQLKTGKARVAIGISHTQAIKTASTFELGGTSTSFTAGSGQSWIGSGISAVATTLSANEETSFSFELEVKGSHELGFTPLGNTTQVQMRSTWPHPSFGGSYLPEQYEISNEGFTANWNLHELARDLPNNWRVDSENSGLGQHLGTVRLFQPVTSYRTIDRATKYGILFIALTFLGFICFELTANLKFHPVQYGVVGVGLVLFYLALLSLSEHISFGFAYTLSTALLTIIMGWYVWAMTKTWRLCLWMAAIVSSLYTTLYVLLQLEDYSLLVGTAVLFVGLLALMYTTRSLTVESSMVTHE
ncbi:MAG: cell envelope integrity protein CreD, partial [Gammaproteobacteria bacterium]|nr:cell envelope integrity protein CreD [Gammaproteobacteria bacterium]